MNGLAGRTLSAFMDLDLWGWREGIVVEGVCIIMANLELGSWELPLLV